MKNLFKTKTAKVIGVIALLMGIAGTAQAVGCYGIYELNWNFDIGHYHQHIRYWHDIPG